MFGISNFVSGGIGNPFARKAILASAVVAALAGGAGSARAGHEDEDRRYDHRHPGRDRKPRASVDIRIGDRRPELCEPRYEERRVRVWVPPVHRTVCDRRYVEPVYRTVCDRRWVEPEYRTVCERVWVEPQYEYRECRHRDRYGRTVIRQERVQVCGGHFESRERKECVREGRWESVDRRECISEGRWESVERQECVSEGHYEFRAERARVADAHEHEPIGGFGIHLRR